jgi:hypothetical protein
VPPGPDATGVDAEIVYRVVEASFTHAEVVELGMLSAAARMDRRGNFSPVRWMRVREFGGEFFLMGEGLATFPLPDPFVRRTPVDE